METEAVWQAQVCAYTGPVVYVKEKHMGLLNIATCYVNNGGKVTDIYDGPGMESEIDPGDNFDLGILKNLPENTRWAVAVVIEALANGAVIENTEKEDIFCAGCAGSCSEKPKS